MLFKPPTTSYQEVPFPDDPYSSSHPDHLAVVAILSGLAQPPVHSCRVLELGCARGGNLIPMAAALPDAQFLGIDASTRQVDEACELIGRLGLRNIRIEAKDILELDGTIGTFDYIICQNTFSWVPHEVKEKILDLSARVLAANGLLYLSYNTYPGWHFRGLAREMMCYHARRFTQPEVIASEARAILQFVAACAGGIEPAYGALLKQELDYVSARSDSYLLHDHLEAVNDPMYFHDFVLQAQSRGLQFVSEVQSTLVPPESLGPEIASALRGLGTDDIVFEQYLDFVINRRFRQSVLCRTRAEKGGGPSHEDLGRLYVSARKMADQNTAVALDGPLLTSALGRLQQTWPLSVPFESLVQEAQTQASVSASGETADQMTSEAQGLFAGLMRCYRQKRVELRTLPPAFVVNLSEKPMASPVARAQAKTQTNVTNLRHEAGQLNEFGCEVLALLDGSHDRAAMVVKLARAVETGRIALKRNDPDVAPGSGGRVRTLAEAVEDSLEDCLKKLARFALLVA